MNAAALDESEGNADSVERLADELRAVLTPDECRRLAELLSIDSRMSNGERL